MSTTAIDTARTNERLSAFQSEIGANEPIDNRFVEIPTLNALTAYKKTQDGGRQIIYPIDSGANGTIAWFSDYDQFDTSAQDTALTVVYPFVNLGATVVISWEEMREIAGSDHRIFDLVKHKRDNVMKSLMDEMNAALYASTQNASKITTLRVAVDSTGAVGGLNASTDADWAAKETASGSFASQGLKDMRSLYNDIANDGAKPDFLVTTQAVYQFYENEIDPDVRYSTIQTGGRGFKTLEFKGVPIEFDADVASGELYMITKKNLFLILDTDGNFSHDDFQSPVNQKVSVSKYTVRGNVVCNRRRSHGKLTGITA